MADAPTATATAKKKGGWPRKYATSGEVQATKQDSDRERQKQRPQVKEEEGEPAFSYYTPLPWQLLTRTNPVPTASETIILALLNLTIGSPITVTLPSSQTDSPSHPAPQISSPSSSPSPPL
jgi:hypothetical protein